MRGNATSMRQIQDDGIHMLTANENELVKRIICPRSKKALRPVSVGDEWALLCPETGVLYPVVDGVIITAPVTEEVKDLCESFLNKNRGALSNMDGGFSMEMTRKALSLDDDRGGGEWSKDEMLYWESLFEHRYKTMDLGRKNWHRMLTRKWLLDRLSHDLKDRIILEIGCGTAATLFDIYGGVLTKYIGLDLSFHACKIAKKQFPGGLFVQGSADALPLEKDSVDVVIAFGVLHHLPEHEAHLKVILPVLKKDGYFIGSDPVLKPRIPRPRFLRNKRKTVSSSSEESVPKTGASPHNEWIDWHNLQRIINGEAEVADTLFEYSPLRAILIDLLYERLRIQTKSFAKTVIALDRLWLATMGKLHRALGPAGVIYVLRRKTA